MQVDGFKTASMLRGQLLQGIALYFQVAEDVVDKDAEGLTLIGSHFKSFPVFKF